MQPKLIPIIGFLAATTLQFSSAQAELTLFPEKNSTLHRWILPVNHVTEISTRMPAAIFSQTETSRMNPGSIWANPTNFKIMLPAAIQTKNSYLSSFRSLYLQPLLKTGLLQLSKLAKTTHSYLKAPLVTLVSHPSFGFVRKDFLPPSEKNSLGHAISHTSLAGHASSEHSMLQLKYHLEFK